jgi:hypothetical protein
MSPNGLNCGGFKSRLAYYFKLTFVTLVLASLTSCGRQSGPVAQEQTNLSWLGSMYRTYVVQNQGRPPKNLDELRKFVEAKTTTEQLARLKVANPGELFVSPRDGKPFAMVSYAKVPDPAAGSPPPVVLYEVEGQNGERAVSFLGGGTKSVDETEFRQLVPAQAKGK